MTSHDNDLYAAIAAQVTQYAHVDVGDDVIETMLTALTTGLVAAVPAALFATITLVEDGKVVSIASTDPIAARIDELQAKHDVGPCLMAARRRWIRLKRRRPHLTTSSMHWDSLPLA